MRICKEGYPFIIGFLLAALVCLGLAAGIHSALFGFLAGICFLKAAFCAYFFRDPARVIPAGGRYLLSPADGKIVDISEGQDASWKEPVWIMRIFLSVFEPHLQRAPIQGRVQAIAYKKGKFLDARHPQAHFENEQNRIEIVPSPGLRPFSPEKGEGTSGTPSPFSGEGGGEGPVVVTQIAGLIARRIVCWVKEGQEVQAGEKIGLIRFGSQVDMVIPKSMKVRVKTGDHVTAGDTIIAEVG